MIKALTFKWLVWSAFGVLALLWTVGSYVAAAFARWGAQADSVIIARSDDPQNHVITGDARSPSTNAFVIAAVTGWLKGRGLATPQR